MLSTKLKLPFSLVSLNKESVRRVTSASVAPISDTNLKPWKDIPGPSSLPIIGQLHHFLPGGSLYNINGAERNMTLYKQFGPIVRFDGIFRKLPLLFLFDAESCAKILRGENGLPVRPGFETLEYYKKNIKRKQGNTARVTSLVTDQGDVWKELRSTVNPILLQPKTIKTYNTVLDEVAQDMIARMRANRDEKNMIRNDFDKEMNLWALESIGTIALGCRLNCFNPNLPPDSPEWQLIQCTHNLIITADQMDNKPSLWRYISTPQYMEAIKLFKHQEVLTSYFIEKGKDLLKKRTQNEKGILEKLLEINEEIAHIMASDLLFAGVDTTSNTVTATLYLLAVNPEKQNKLREEILSKSEQKPYLKACIKESIRMMPIVPGNVRLTTKEYDILGYSIPKNVQVMFNHRDMSLMEEYYSKPREFIPERWLASKDDPLFCKNSHPFAHLPFGFGIRSCIGRRIAELEIEIFMARIIENFKVEWFGPPPEILKASLNYIKGPYNFVFIDV